MSSLFAVLLNGIAQLEYDRNKPLSDFQGTYLEKMDQKMADEGITIGDTTIENPDLGQRAQFVAANLAHAIKSNDEAMCAAMTSWITRFEAGKTGGRKRRNVDRSRVRRGLRAADRGAIPEAALISRLQEIFCP